METEEKCKEKLANMIGQLSFSQDERLVEMIAIEAMLYEQIVGTAKEIFPKTFSDFLDNYEGSINEKRIEIRKHYEF